MLSGLRKRPQSRPFSAPRSRAGGRAVDNDGARDSRFLRAHSQAQHATNVELFFDLVYVFAITQLSHRLLNHATIASALETLLLFAMVWLVWAYTTWVTNWLDPERLPVRSVLLALMIASLVMSAALPEAFSSRGLWVGGAYAGMHPRCRRRIVSTVAVSATTIGGFPDAVLAFC